ncbi:hypothetical protein JOM56_011279 [Amanita muscaria]
MLCRPLLLALLSIALSSSVVQALPQGNHRSRPGPTHCPPPVTVTISARTAIATGKKSTGTKTTGIALANNATATTTQSSSAPASTATNNAATSNDPQTSLTLDPKVIAKGFENNGQGVPSPGQVASLTSSNNFINFCLTVPNLPITNGQQISTGSCNPAPMGVIPSVDNMPSAKFVFPTNLVTIKANTAFTVKLAMQNMETGNFVNAQQNYFSAPQQVNNQGQIKGHSHVVIEQLTAIDQTTPTDPRKFAFFKGLNGAAQGGILTADVTSGLPAGVYKVSTINTASNHQAVAVPVAQRGSLDDAVYFTITADGQPAPGSTGATSSSLAGGAGTQTPSPSPSNTDTNKGGAAPTPATSSPAPKATNTAGNGKATPSPAPSGKAKSGKGK